MRLPGSAFRGSPLPTGCCDRVCGLGQGWKAARSGHARPLSHNHLTLIGMLAGCRLGRITRGWTLSRDRRSRRWNRHLRRSRAASCHRATTMADQQAPCRSAGRCPADPPHPHCARGREATDHRSLDQGMAVERWVPHRGPEVNVAGRNVQRAGSPGGRVRLIDQLASTEEAARARDQQVGVAAAPVNERARSDHARAAAYEHVVRRVVACQAAARIDDRDLPAPLALGRNPSRASHRRWTTPMVPVGCRRASGLRSRAESAGVCAGRATIARRH